MRCTKACARNAARACARRWRISRPSSVRRSRSPTGKACRTVPSRRGSRRRSGRSRRASGRGCCGCAPSWTRPKRAAARCRRRAGEALQTTAATSERDAYRRAVQRVLWTTLVLNAAVALAKLVVGLRTHTLTLVGDSAHSTVDAVNNVIGLLAVGVAAKEADADHPYGHSKFETLAAFVLSGLLFLTCAQLAIEAVQRLMHGPERIPEATPLAFAVTLDRKSTRLNSSHLG